MENDEVREDFIDEMKSKNDPIEGWSIKRLKKEAEESRRPSGLRKTMS